MKNILYTLTLVASLAAPLMQAQTITYKWNFDLTNSAAGTNVVNSTVPGGNLQGSAVTTTEAVLQMVNSAGTLTNLLGLPGSGVGTNFYDRAALLPGASGGAGPLMATPALANTLTNLGLLTNFTITAWIKADGGSISGFPRVLLLGPQNVDISTLNSMGLLFFSSSPTFNSVQFKLNNVSTGGFNGPNGYLTPYLGDWFFLAVTYDSTVDTTAAAPGGTNLFFYVGNRFNTLAAGAPGKYTGTTVNSAAPAATTGPGYVNFSGGPNGDGSFSTVSNQAWCYIGNQPGRGRAFNGRYDDIRFYANQVLNQSQLDAIRLSSNLKSPDRLTISNQPQNTAVTEGQGAAFSVVINPVANPTYQWYRINPSTSVSNLIVGATNQNYQTAPLTVASDNGAKYAVLVHSTDPFSDFGGTGIYSTYATVTVTAASALAATANMLKFEYFTSDNGVSVGNFLATPTTAYLNNAPDLTSYLPTFDTRNVFADDTHFNYFVRVTGSITPTVTTNYVFYVRSGDEAQFYLSTDGGSTSNLLVQDTAAGLQTFTGPESTVSVAGNRFSSPIALTAGTSYPITAFLKVSSGAQMLQVAWRMDSGLQDLPASDEDIADRLKPIFAGVLSTTALPSGTVGITTQPQPVTPSAVANSKVTFTVAVTNTANANNTATTNGPLVVQWQKNGVNIYGAVGKSYTTPYLSTSDNGATFRAVVSVPGVSSNSQSSTLTVTADSTPPTVISATGEDTMTSVVVKFSEPLDPLTALDPTKYSINGGALAVSNVAWAVGTNLVDNPTYDSVRFTTALQATTTVYNVVVTGVKDTAANTIVSGNSVSFKSFGLSSGYVKFEYYEVQQYTSLLGQNVIGFVTLSPKFMNSDPDTVVFPTSAEMSPDGNSTIRSSSGGNSSLLPPNYGTRMVTMFSPPVTTNYVFYTAGNDSMLLWLSTDANPANKHLIAYRDIGGGKRVWTGSTYGNTSIFPTNIVDGTTIAIPGATPWPVADANGYATITLTNGQRYYLEVDHLENAGFDSFDAVTAVSAADNTTVVAPNNGSAPLTGNSIGWYFPQPQISTFVQSGSNVTIGWTNNFGQMSLGAVPYPGIAPGTITASFPSSALQATPSLSPTAWTVLTNTSPATFPATNPAQFFRVTQ